MAMAGQYRGNNNGGLELTVAFAEEYGISKGELYAGLRLAVLTKLLIRTVQGKQTHGKGIPAKYALSWRAMNEFIAYNLVETSKPRHEWITFEPDVPRLRSLLAAERYLGWRKPGASSLYSTPGGDSIEASGTAQTKKLDESVASQTKTVNGSGVVRRHESAPSQTKKRGLATDTTSGPTR